jgi:hypothetical protein
LTVYVVVGAVLFAIGFAAVSWYGGLQALDPFSILKRPTPRAPYVAPMPKVVTKWRTRTVQVPVTVLSPTPAEEKKAQADFGVTPAPKEDKRLGIWEVGTAKRPVYGHATVDLKPDGSPVFTVYEAPQPFLQWGGPWLVGGGVTYGTGGTGGTVLAGKELFRTGKITWQADVRGSYAGQKFDGRAELLAVVKISPP